MAFAVRAGDIKRIVKAIAQSGGDRRALMPDILQNYVSIRQEGETINLEARSGNIYISSHLQVFPILDDGKMRVLAPKKALKDLITTYNDDDVLSFRYIGASGAEDSQMSNSTSEELLVIQSNETSQYHIKCASPEEWNGIFTELEGSKVELSLPASLLLQGIEKVAFAAAKEDARESLNGINFTISENQIRLVGTDAITLSMCLIKNVEINTPKVVSFTLPNDTVEALDNFFSGKEQNLITIKIIQDRDEQIRMVGFSDARNTIYSYVINYPFPSIDGIIKPESEYKVFIVNKDKFMESMKRFQKIADSREQTFNLQINDSSMILTLYSYNFGEGQEVVGIEGWDDGEVSMSFSVSRIVDILSNIVDVEDVRVGIQDVNKPVAFFYEDETGGTQVQILTMPALR